MNLAPKTLLLSLSMDRFNYPTEGRFKLRWLQRRPLLGLLYVASALKAKGMEVEILDQSVIAFNASELITRLRKDKYLFIGFYSQLLIKDKVAEYIKEIKEIFPALPVIVGGPGHLFYEDFLRNGCDIVCLGEAEDTIKEVVDYLKGERKIETIDGIAYQERGQVLCTKKRALIDNLDTLPFPSWEMIDLKQYRDYYILPLQKPFVPMITSRGCVFDCAFCSSPFLWGNAFRSRSVENVLEEIDFLVLKYGIKYIIFQDDLFGYDNNWLRKFCSSLIARKCRTLHWMCLLHPLVFKDNPEQLIGLMRKAGCNLFVFGLQTAEPVLAKIINRSPLEAEILPGIIKLAHDNGIMTVVDFILGLPGESQQTVRRSIDFALQARPCLVNFHPLRIEPGSKLWEQYQGKYDCAFSYEELSSLSRKANLIFYFRINSIVKIMSIMLKRILSAIVGLPRKF